MCYVALNNQTIIYYVVEQTYFAYIYFQVKKRQSKLIGTFNDIESRIKAFFEIF